MFNRLYSMVVKELLQFFRDPLLLSVVLIAPALELVLIGGGVGDGGANVPTAFVDLDGSQLSRELYDALDNTQELRIAYYLDNFDEAVTLIDAGDAVAIIAIPPGFGSDIQSGNAVQVQLILDGSNVSVAGDAQGAAQGAIERLGWHKFVSLVAPTGQAGIDLRQEALYNQALESQPHKMTSLLAFIVFEIVTLAAVMSIVKEREVGTLEQVGVTPLRQVEVIIGKALSPMLVGFANFLILFSAVRLIFDLPIRGSFLLLAGLTALYLVSEVCVSLMISAVSQTQQQAITITFIWIMLALTMSGYMVPITNLPPFLRLGAQALPLQHYIVIVRAIMLKGVGINILWSNALALFILDIVVIAVTAWMMRRLGK